MKAAAAKNGRSRRPLNWPTSGDQSSVVALAAKGGELLRELGERRGQSVKKTYRGGSLQSRNDAMVAAGDQRPGRQGANWVASCDPIERQELRVATLSGRGKGNHNPALKSPAATPEAGRPRLQRILWVDARKGLAGGGAAKRSSVRG